MTAEVCGSDGKTYSNACFMLGESCQAGTPYVSVVSEGKCKSNSNNDDGKNEWMTLIIDIFEIVLNLIVNSKEISIF